MKARQECKKCVILMCCQPPGGGETDNGMPVAQSVVSGRIWDLGYVLQLRSPRRAAQGEAPGKCKSTTRTGQNDPQGPEPQEKEKEPTCKDGESSRVKRTRRPRPIVKPVKRNCQKIDTNQNTKGAAATVRHPSSPIKDPSSGIPMDELATTRITQTKVSTYLADEQQRKRSST
ncbi:hypothetical protein NDU88_005610 [Pleurodeles waltl]|uniref:Uncharacterized protein n=1 Tax=Pleurodeles waltl TaxID=8319 RepID=A0AAV7TCR1_PLEWA|nr:hypothetical protein NDU88_005610 [Pleurodeles waltl]